MKKSQRRVSLIEIEKLSWTCSSLICCSDVCICPNGKTNYDSKPALLRSQSGAFAVALYNILGYLCTPSNKHLMNYLLGPWFLLSTFLTNTIAYCHMCIMKFRLTIILSYNIHMVSPSTGYKIFRMCYLLLFVLFKLLAGVKGELACGKFTTVIYNQFIYSYIYLS